jgi:peptidoglycan hydrolase-like protein with peptidoglycan-binding domain
MFIFIDYASVDANRPPDWTKLKAAASGAGSTLSGVIFRGAWGGSPDPIIARDWMNARSAGLITGAYLYLRMQGQSLLAPEDQVHVFADNVGTLTDRDLVPAIDVEDRGLTAPAELEWVERAWREMVSIYGVSPLVYTSDRVWSEDVNGLASPELQTSPLWLAKPWPWHIHTPAQLSPGPFQSGQYAPPVPRPWGAGNWWLHQYQGDAYPTPGITNTVDISRFNPMGQGERGVRVSWVQRRIGAAPDGVFGPQTAVALRQFQSSHMLVADAIVGPQTFVALMWAPPAVQAA